MYAINKNLQYYDNSYNSNSSLPLSLEDNLDFSTTLKPWYADFFMQSYNIQPLCPKSTISLSKTFYPSKRRVFGTGLQGGTLKALYNCIYYII